MNDIPKPYIDAGATVATKAKAAFDAMMLEFLGGNIATQITRAGKTELLGETFKDVQYWGSIASLYEVYKSLEKIKPTPEMAPFFTEKTKREMKNRIVEILSTL
jgi:hypothetical protein